MRPRKRDRHLPSCVFLRHGAYYYVKDGKWIPIGKDLREALAEFARRTNTSAGSMPQLIDRALDANKHKYAQNTWRNYQFIKKKLQDVLAEFNPEDVLPRHIADIRMNLGKTPALANRALSVLAVTFDYAVEQQLVDRNPCVGIKRMESKARDRLITQDEFNRIREKATPQIQIIMDLCYLTAQRISDVLGIRYSDLLPEGIAFKQQKTGARLVVGWTPELEDVVARAKELHGNLRALTLLHDRRGRALRYVRVNEQWLQAVRSTDVTDARLHDLRAMSGTAVEAQGGDPQKLLGHTNPATTKRYLRSKKIPVVKGPSIGQVFGNWTDHAKKSKH